MTEHILCFTPALLTRASTSTRSRRISLIAHLSKIYFYYQIMPNSEGWNDAQRKQKHIS